MDAREPQNDIIGLPTLVMTKIFHYLDVDDLRSMSRVNKQCYQLLSDEIFWKERISRFWLKTIYPPVNFKLKDQQEISWKRAAITREKAQKIWGNHAETTCLATIAGDASSVDSVHITTEGLLAAGTRGRTLLLTDLANIPKDQNSGTTFTSVNYTSHKGWVWTLCSSDRFLGSGSWDRKFMRWDLQLSELSEPLETYTFTSACLCSKMEGNDAYVGTFNSTIYHIDFREPDPREAQSINKGSVLSLLISDRYLITSHEKSTLQVQDRHTLQTISSVKTKCKIPAKLTIVGETLYVGGQYKVEGAPFGCMELYKFDHMTGALVFIESTIGDERNHTAQITGISFNFGGIFTCAESRDQTVKIWEPTRKPQLFAEIKTPNSISSMDVWDNTVALGMANGDVMIYQPIQPQSSDE